MNSIDWQVVEDCTKPHCGVIAQIIDRAMRRKKLLRKYAVSSFYMLINELGTAREEGYEFDAAKAFVASPDVVEK